MKILLTLLLAVSVGSLWANPISVDNAKIVAESVFGKNTQKSSSIVSLEYVGISNGDTVYYIFSNADGGFAIVSADDAAVPLLGYSRISQVGNVNTNKMLKYQLERYGGKISELKHKNATNASVLREWRMFSDTVASDSEPADTVIADTILTDDTVIADTIVEVLPLITSQWEQSGYYNDSCPTYVGCVAIAMGQVMRYHQWPQKGRGWHAYTPSNMPELGVQYANFGATEYRWDLMPDRLRDYTPQESKSAVAQLLRHIGVSVNMSYMDDGSGAYTIDIPSAMANYFLYNSQTLQLCSYDSFSVEEWLDLIKSELNAGRPVIYSGVHGDNGHSWVVDGYDSDGYLHVNWGWGGDYDGYFLADKMILENVNYDAEIEAIIGIQPSAGPAPLLWTMQSSGFNSLYRGVGNISAVDGLTAWASSLDSSNGQGIEFTRTTNGGELWTSGYISFPGYRNYSVSSISAVSKLEAWASVYVDVKSRTVTGGKIVHTVDGGKIWTVQASAAFSGNDAFPNTVYFWDAKNGVCLGDPNDGYFEIYTTTDGGENWSRVPQSRIPVSKKDETGVVNCYAVCGNVIYFSTTYGRLFRSVDRGATWTVSDTPLKSYFQIAFRNDECGVIKGTYDDGFLACSTFDGGDSWTVLDNHDNFYPTALGYIPGTDTLISVGGYSDNGIFLAGISFSTNDGETFTDYADFYCDVDMYSALGISPDGKSIWIGAYNLTPYYGGMWHRGILGTYDINSGIGDNGEVDNNMSEQKLSVYPNPSSGIINIESAEPIVQVEMAAISGNVLMSLPINACKAILDVQGLPSGFYIVIVRFADSLVCRKVLVD